jgi:hypothetical protein
LTGYVKKSASSNPSEPKIFSIFCCCRYEHQEIALNCGTMLRECARYEALAKIMLDADDFFNFFRYVEVSTFDIASDAFSTFKVLACNVIK